MEVKRIRTGVKALIVHQDKILVIKERVHREEGAKIITDFPGGGIGVGEDLKTALKREVFEEVGLKIEVGKLVGVWEFVVPSHEDKGLTGVQIVCVGYQCIVVSDHKTKNVSPTLPASEIVLDTSKNPAHEDIFDAVWLTKEEILAGGKEILPLPEMKKAVANLIIKK